MTLDGANLTDRNPASVNNVGSDAKVVDAGGSIPNGASSASLRFGTSGDNYYPAVLTTQVDLFAPTINGTKSVTNISGNDPARVGDVLEYSITYSNTGDDTATGAVLRDNLPANVTFVPGSLKVTAGANAGQQDRRGRHRPGRVRRRHATGAGPGGHRRHGCAHATSAAPSSRAASTTVVFRVTIDPSGAGTAISNTSQLDYKALSHRTDLHLRHRRDREPGRRARRRVHHQVRLAQPGGGRRAPHLHAQRRQRGSQPPPRASRCRTPCPTP